MSRPHLEVVPHWQVPLSIERRLFLVDGGPRCVNGLFALRDECGALYYVSVGRAGRLHFWREVQR